MMLAVDQAAQIAIRREWQAAVGEYQRLRAKSDAMPPGTEGEDDALDAYCVAMDRLLGTVRAPNLAAVIYKIDLMAERYEAAIVPDEWIKAIRADLVDIDARGDL